MPTTKKVETVTPSPALHWVGDGFPVSSIFSPQAGRARMSPFILMDYGGPVRFEPAARPRGVGPHPHRGFETVTVVYQGEVEHRDSAGNGGKIGPGDVQWMTAASGVVHEELHSRAFTKAGGVMEMAQIWVNLPAKSKMTPPRYQTLVDDAIPRVVLADEAGTVRVIAGELDGARGAAKTVTPVLIWDVALRKGAQVDLPIRDGFTAAVFVRSGSIHVAGTHAVGARHFATFSRAGAGVSVRADEESELLVLGGEPIDEPVAAYGPFVMNTEAEIETAIRDFQAGKLGRLE